MLTAQPVAIMLPASRTGPAEQRDQHGANANAISPSQNANQSSGVPYLHWMRAVSAPYPHRICTACAQYPEASRNAATREPTIRHQENQDVGRVPSIESASAAVQLRCSCSAAAARLLRGCCAAAARIRSSRSPARVRLHFESLRLVPALRSSGRLPVKRLRT